MTILRKRLALNRAIALFLILLVALPLSSFFTSIPAIRADAWAGWEAIDTIYYNPSQEDANNPYLETAANELETYLEQMSGRSWTIVTNSPPATPAIYLAVDATMLESYGDEAFRLVVNNDGVTITGKTPIAVRWGAYHLLDEKLGVRWFFKNTAWTVVPTSLSDLSATDEIHEPDFLWRQFQATSSLGKTDYADWLMHNRLYGAKSYDIYQSYGYILHAATGWYYMTDQEKLDYYNAHPDYFLPDNRYPDYPWQLNPENPDVINMAIQYARDYLDAVPFHTPGDQYNDALYFSVVPISPNDGQGFSPPYTEGDYQTITDKVFGLANAVAANISQDYPGRYVGLYDYADYSVIPSIELEPNILAVIASSYNYSDLSNKERVEGMLAKGVVVGWRDYLNVWTWYADDNTQVDCDAINIVKWLASKGITYYNGEATDSWGNGAGVEYYVLSKLLWDSSLNFQDIISDFYTKAFGSAATVMRDYYEIRDTDNISLARSFNDLSQAETLAAGDPAVLTRIRQLEYYNRFLWKWHNIGISNLSLADLEDFYTFICKTRDTYMIDYTNAEPELRAELISRGLTSEQVDALQNFNPPTVGETSAWLSEALSAFSSYMNLPAYINARLLDLEALGDTTAPAVDPLYGNTRDILVYSDGNENITISAKTDYQFKIDWYNPSGILTDSWIQIGTCDWTNHTFAATIPGYYLLHVNRGFDTEYTYIDVPDRPASMLADFRPYLFNLEKDSVVIHTAPQWTGGNTQYFYVPPGTSSFTFGATVYWTSNDVTGSLTDPNNISHSFNWSYSECPYIDPNSDMHYNEMTLTNPQAGLWKLSVDPNPNWNYFWFKGIPPLIWHDPEYLLVPASASQPVGDPDINSDGVVNILDIICVAQHWNETGANGWIKEDINSDGIINILDISLVCQNWTK
jgi:hypothetical protein